MKRWTGTACIALACSVAAARMAQAAPAERSTSPGKLILSRFAASVAAGTAPRLETLRAAYTVTMAVGDEATSVDQLVSYALPDKVRQVVETPLGRQVVVLNGDRGAMTAGGQTLPFPPQRVADGLRSLGRELIVLASFADDPRLEAVAAGREEIDGRPCDVVRISFLGAESRLFFDEQGRVVKQTYPGNHPLQGIPGVVEVRYSDYAATGGRMLPRRQVLSFDGEPLATVTLRSLEVNPELDPADFAVE